MNIVVQMLIRNEGDVIYETLCEITRWGLYDVVILDGQSDDHTLTEIHHFQVRHPDINIHLTSEDDPGGEFHDHLRNRLLDLTLRHNPDWIISLDADEIYHTDPVAAIAAADAEGANVLYCLVPQFWITIDDIRHGILLEDERESIQRRRLWYSWGHTGRFIWKALPGHFYPQNEQKRTPELPDTTWREWQICGSVTPICKHYCFRTLEQGLKRMRERQARGGTKYFGKYFYNWIIDEQAAGLARFAGEWDTRYTHQSVSDYMGDKL